MCVGLMRGVNAARWFLGRRQAPPVGRSQNHGGKETTGVNARSEEGIEHVANPRAARRSWPRGSSMGYSITRSAKIRSRRGATFFRACDTLLKGGDLSL